MERLRQVLAQKDTVLFIGSGISLWSGLPSWTDVIEELAQFVEASGVKADLIRAEAEKGELLQAASYGFDKLTNQQIGEFIRATCRYGVAEPHEIHRKIISLGPRCFVTTNYDNLIEQSLQKWQPDRFYRTPVTNRHLTETAEIVQTRAINFIFKPHGDAGDTDTIILTREQYRDLLPQGERHAALESLKTLLVSRPVVYFGFGLRDPDFIYVRDVLANIYKGGTREHYAIMADITDDESTYWRRHYGIHLVNYATTASSDTTKAHSALLTLLDTFLEREPATATATTFDPTAPAAILALTRHAAASARSPKLVPELQLRVYPEREGSRGTRSDYRLDDFEHAPVEKFLDNGPPRAVLIGVPGAGKTYSIRRSVARLADKLHDSCLSDHFDGKSVVVPILADLKLYGGDLVELVSDALPQSLRLKELMQFSNVKIFLDSFNEMPREYLESGAYEADFTNFAAELGDSSLVIGSRTSDGLLKLGLPVYNLDYIDEIDVATELRRLEIEIEGPFSREVQSLLRRPFYFRQVTSGAIRLPRHPHPRDFYRMFFNNLRVAFEGRFGIQLDLERVLSRTAYAALDGGQEAFLLSELLRILEAARKTRGITGIDARDVANWLVSSTVVVPYTRGRVAFVHQSVTEYLAASELARRFQSSRSILKDKLRTKRWDQALFLALSLLPTAVADVFLDDVIEADAALALRAAKYLEVGWENVVKELLSKIPERMNTRSVDDRDIEAALQFIVPLTTAHEDDLRRLVKNGGGIGAACVLRLVELKGEGVKDELLRLLVDRCDDYNLCCNGVAAALKPFATEEDAKNIAAWADSWPAGSDYNKIDGFVEGSAQLLSGLDVSVIRREVVPMVGGEKGSEIRMRLVCSLLRGHYTTEALDLAGELLCRGVMEAATTIYFIGTFAPPETELSWRSFSAVHVKQLISVMGAEGSFALGALGCVCAARPDLSETVEREASRKMGIEKAALLYGVLGGPSALVFRALIELVEISDDARQKQPVQLLKGIELEWGGQEELFVRLLRLRDLRLASALLGSSIPPGLRGLRDLNIGSIFWWLEWMMEVHSEGSDFWFLQQLGGLFGGHLDRAVQDEFVFEFNKAGSKFWQLMLRFVLPHFAEITTEDFSDEAITALLADLNYEGSALGFRGHLLGNTATDEFVDERLLPLLADARQPLLNNLYAVLRQAGSRHNRRYFLESSA